MRSLAPRLNRSDPARQGAIIRGYERDVAKLFKSFRKEIPNIIKSSSDLNLISVNHDTALARVATEIENKIRKPAMVVAKEWSERSYQGGMTRGSQFLQAMRQNSFFNWTPKDAGILKILFQRNLASIMKITDNLAGRIQSELADGILQGEGIPKLTKRLTEAADISVTQARTVARTESSYAFNEGLTQQYERHGVEEVEWITSRRSGICDTCDALDGQTFEIEEQPACPQHPNCRCTVLPVIEEV
jgi:SPP1 gp7 family putative phage head morphogenesis protein